MTAAELAAALAPLAASNAFAKSLVRQYRLYGELSPRQIEAGARLVQKQQGCLCSLPMLAEFLKQAQRKTGAHVTFRNIHNVGSNGGTVAIKWDTRRRCWWITDGAGYPSRVTYARMDENGDLHPTNKCLQAVMVMLDELEVDPMGFIRNNGKQSGVCCFCRSELTDPPSLEAGYGPVCAKTYRLPWGGKS